jgi:hypothetical protein
MRRIAFGLRRLVAALGFWRGQQAALRIRWALLVFLLPTATLAQSGVISLKSGTATITIEAPAADGTREIPYAPVPFTLTVDSAAPLKVKLPKTWTTSDAWHVFPKGPAAESGLDKNRTRWTQAFFLEPLVAGVHELQLEPLQIKEAAGPWQTLSWKPVQLTVRPPQSEGDVSQLRDITSIEELPPTRSWTESWPWFVGAGGLLVLAGLAAWVWRRTRTYRAGLSAEDWARQEVDRLVALDLPGRGAARRFHTLLSNVLRRYLERRFFVPARRQTTPEFLRTASQDGMFTPEQQQFLRDVLERFDLAKFAAAEPSAAECQTLADRTRGFISQTARPSAAS